MLVCLVQVMNLKTKILLSFYKLSYPVTLKMTYNYSTHKSYLNKGKYAGHRLFN